MSRRDAIRKVCLAAAALATERIDLVAEAANRAPEIVRRRIPSSGESLPVIGLGTWQTFDVDRSPAARAPLAEVLKAFSELGGKLIDSSPM
jgi:hypothetical protein